MWGPEVRRMYELVSLGLGRGYFLGDRRCGAPRLARVLRLTGRSCPPFRLGCLRERVERLLLGLARERLPRDRLLLVSRHRTRREDLDHLEDVAAVARGRVSAGLEDGVLEV